MNRQPLYWRRATAVAFTAIALVACGGGDDGPAAVAVASADTVAVKWNAASTLDVTANDTIANGAGSVSVKTAPAHGTATVDGRTLRYTPSANYFGSDTLRYVLTVGDKTSEADVQLTVNAEFTLAGRVHDAPLAGASVVATVGATVLAPVVTAADGSYRVTVRSADPSAFVSLQATGAGAQSTVVLKSLLGELRELAPLAAAAASAASGTPTLTVAMWPAADVTHISTATAALAQIALGKPVASAADLASVQGRFNGDQVIDVATAIKLVADNGVALPAGSATTLALAGDAAAVASLLVAQSAADPVAYVAAQQSVLGDIELAAPPPLPTAANPSRTVLIVTGRGAASIEAERIVLNLDKTASYVGSEVRIGTWSSSGAEVTVMFATAIASVAYSNDIDPTIGRQSQMEYRNTGLTFRLLGNSGAVAPASVRSEGSIYHVDGSKAGTSVPYDATWYARVAISAAQPFTAADTAPGARWAGVVSFDATLTSEPNNQDVMRFVDATTVVYERVGLTGTYRLVDGQIEVTVGDAVYTYARLFTGPAGEERWLDTKRVGAALQWAFEAATVKAGTGLAFTADALAQKWTSYINAAVSDSKFRIDLRADGTAVGVTVNADGVESVGRKGTWRVDGGAMVFDRYSSADCLTPSASCTPFSTRTWTLLGTSGKQIYVMERLNVVSIVDQWRVNVYTKP